MSRHGGRLQSREEAIRLANTVTASVSGRRSSGGAGAEAALRCL